jgi:hypothetical protein
MYRSVAAFLFLIVLPVAAFGQTTFGATSTTNSYTEELSVQNPDRMAYEIRNHLSYQGFRVYRETEDVTFLRKPRRLMTSGYMDFYDEATVWVRDSARVRVHIWRRVSNLKTGNSKVYKMPEDAIENYRDGLNEYFNQ